MESGNCLLNVFFFLVILSFKCLASGRIDANDGLPSAFSPFGRSC